MADARIRRAGALSAEEGVVVPDVLVARRYEEPPARRQAGVRNRRWTPLAKGATRERAGRNADPQASLPPRCTNQRRAFRPVPQSVQGCNALTHLAARVNL
jgi:hypothetical protein